jgi:signal transduction histidine kinase
MDDDLPEVEADPEAVSQAVINLLENSIKYSPEEKHLHLSVRAVDGSVEISLADRGVGIAAEDQKRVLEDYYRTREARALGTRGSGLGLSVVQHIMEAHSGKVRLESQPGQGSRFTLVFPAASPRPHRSTTEIERPAPARGKPIQDNGKATT